MKEALITQWESCKAQWVNIVFQLFRISIMDVFLIFLRRRRFEKIEKFNALKAARPEVAVDTEILWNLLLKRKLRPKIYIQISTKNR
jgi:hypothetical protein